MNVKKYSKTYNFMFILLCAFYTGFLWRLRGDHGWGSFKGMTAVALGLLLAIISFMPYRKKINTEIFPFVILLTALTNSGWGTLNSQITGFLGSGTDAPAVFISPVSGAAVMFLLGFGWAPFLAMFIGYYLSDKKPKYYHYLIVIAVYFAVEYITKASISHLAVKLVSPTAEAAFADTLKSQGFDLTPYKAYLAHFDNISWAKKLDFGRNYFQTVETCSQTFATLASIIYVRFAAKDKTAAKIQTLVCASFGIAITAADLFIFLADGGFRNSLANVPQWLTGWSNWEYWTGFIAGLLIAVIIVVYVKKHPGKENLRPECILPDKKPIVFIRNYLAVAFPVIMAAAVPLSIRLTYVNDFFFRNVSFSDDEILCIPFAAAAGILMIFPAVKMMKKELLGEKELIIKAAPVMLTASFGVFSLLYFCTGNAYLLNGSKTDISITMYISAAIIALLLFLLNKIKTKA